MFKNFKKSIIFSNMILLIIFLLFIIISIYIITSNVMKDISIENAIQYANQASKTASEIIKYNSDNPIEKLQNFVDKQVSESNGSISYAVIIDKNVQAIAHSDKEKIGKIYEDDYTIDAATKGVTQNSKFYADVQKIWTYDIMVPIIVEGEQVSSLDMGIPISGINEVIFAILKFMIAASLVFLVILTLLQNLFINKALDPINKIDGFLQKQANLDFSSENEDSIKDFFIRKDLIGTLSNSIKKSSNAVKKFIQNIDNTSHKLLDESEIFKNSATESSSINKEIYDMIYKISKDATNQETQVRKSEDNMNKIEEVIENLFKLSNELNQSTKNVLIEKNKGMQSIKKLMDNTIKSEEALDVVSDVVNSSSESAIKIKNASDMISEIADQTNLLALNAAIEIAVGM